MAFGTVSDPLLAGALWLALAVLVATGALLAVTIVIRWRLLRRMARERRTADLWNPLLAQCAERVPGPLPVLPARDAESFLVLWCRAQESLRGEAQAELREMGRRLRLQELARQLLGSRKLRLKLLALITLGHLRDAGVVPLLRELIPAASSAVSLTAGQALLRIDARLGVPRLLAATVHREDWPLATVVSILRECDAGLVGPMLAVAIRTELGRRRDGGGVARLLRLHVAAHGEVLRATVLTVLTTAQDREALAAALAALWHPLDASHARRLLGHPESMVRVAAARALGRFGGADDFEPLSAALGDPSWWVRHRAAQALCALPGIGATELGALLERLGDRFAADALRQALADRGAA